MAKTRDMIADILIDAGIDHVFGIPGGSNMFLFDPLFDRQDKIKTVLARTEHAAGCMADMYGRLTGKPGVMIAQGAWAGSLGALAVMEAYLAGSPMLVFAEMSDYGGLTHHMPYQCMSGEYGSVDLRNVFKSMTKYTSVAHSPSEYVHAVQLAIKHAVTGKPGPAAVIARWNVVTSEIDPAFINPPLHSITGRLRVSPPCIGAADAAKIAAELIAAKNPVMILGAGIHASGAYAEVRELAELLGLPVATSLMGKSALPEIHDLALGISGNIGQKAANEKIKSADLIFAVATGLAPENNKMLAPDFINAAKQKIIQIDIEPLNVGFTYPVFMGVTSEARLALIEIIKAVKAARPKIDVKKRIDEIKKFKAEHKYFQDDADGSDETPMAPERIVKDITDALGEDALVVLDGGNNKVWMAHHFQTKVPGQIVIPGGVTGIGWSVPAALCAQLVKKDKKVVGVCGDGGFMFGLYAFEMAKQYNLPVTWIVLNNGCLGNVQDFQPADRHLATDYNMIDVAAYARGAGCEGFKIEKAEDFKPALHEAVNNGKPTVVDVLVKKQSHFKTVMTS